MNWINVGVLSLSAWMSPGAPVQQEAPPPPPPAFEGSAELSFVGTTGNSSTRTVGAATTLVFRPHDWSITSKAAFIRSEDRGTTKAESTNLSTKVGRDLTERLSLGGHHQYTRDQFAGINHRNTVDVGLTYDVVESATQKLVVDAGIGYANEQRRAGRNLSSAIGTAGVTYTVALSDHATLEDEVSAVASFKNGRDRRLANVASLSAKLTTLFSLKVTHTTRWIKSPVPGFKKTDTVTAVALVAKF